MNCKKIQSDLIFFFYKELPEAKYQIIEAHLQECEKCNLIFLKLKSSLSVIETEKEIEVNPFIYTRIQQQIAQISNKQNAREFVPVFKRIFQPALITLVIIFGLLLGIFIGNHYQTNNNSIYLTNQSQTEEYYLNDFQQEPYLSYLIEE